MQTSVGQQAVVEGNPRQRLAGVLTQRQELSLQRVVKEPVPEEQQDDGLPEVEGKLGEEQWVHTQTIPSGGSFHDRWREFSAREYLDNEHPLRTFLGDSYPSTLNLQPAIKENLLKKNFLTIMFGLLAALFISAPALHAQKTKTQKPTVVQTGGPSTVSAGGNTIVNQQAAPVADAKATAITPSEQQQLKDTLANGTAIKNALENQKLTQENVQLKITILTRAQQDWGKDATNLVDTIRAAHHFGPDVQFNPETVQFERVKTPQPSK